MVSWSCLVCTFVNQCDQVTCAMCGTPQPVAPGEIRYYKQKERFYIYVRKSEEKEGVLSHPTAWVRLDAYCLDEGHYAELCELCDSDDEGAKPMEGCEGYHRAIENDNPPTNALTRCSEHLQKRAWEMHNECGTPKGGWHQFYVDNQDDTQKKRTKRKRAV